MRKTYLTATLSSFAVASSLLVLTPQGAIALPTPAQVQPMESSQQLLTWAAVDGASAYRVELSSDPSFATTLETVNTYAQNYVPRLTHSTAEDRTLYWRVAAYTSGTTASTLAPWSEPQTIDVAAAEVPATTTPATGDELSYPDAVSFSWPTVDGAVGYKLEYAPTADFTGATVIDAGELTANRYSPKAPLAEGTWYWRVSAKLAGSPLEKNNYTPTSTPVEFSVTWDDVAAAPQLLTPASATETTPPVTDPVFSWSEVQGAQKYRLVVARDADLTNLLFPATDVYGTAFVPDNNLLGGEYYWQVTAYDTAGNAGAPSSVQKFVKRWGAQAGPSQTEMFNEVAPTPLTGSAKLDEAEPQAQERFELRWEPVARATAYEVTISELGGSTTVCKTAGTSLTSIASYSRGENAPDLLKGADDCKLILKSGSTYQWRVRALDYNASSSSTIQGNVPAGAVVSALSEPRYFTGGELLPGNEFGEEVQKHEDAFLAQERLTTAPAPLMSWDKVAGADGYEVRIYRGSGISGHVASFRTSQTMLRPNGVLLDDNTGESYYWRVKAIQGSITTSSPTYFGLAGWDQISALSWTRTTTPTVIPEVYSEPRGGAVLLKWTPQYVTAPEEDSSRGYQLSYRETKAVSWTNVKLEYPFWIPKASSDKPLKAGDYEFLVRPMDANGTPGRASEIKSFAIGASAPEEIEVTVEGSVASVDWSPVATAEAYQVQYQKDGGGTVTKKVTAQTATEFSGLSAGTYTFRVGVEPGYQEVLPLSGPAVATVEQRQVELVTPEAEVLSSSDRTLRWNEVPGASRYLVQMGTTEAGLASSKVYETSSTSFTPDASVAFGKVYYWRVLAVAEQGTSTATLNNRVILATSPAQTVYFRTTPSAPSQSSPKLAGEGAVQVAWTPLTGAAAGSEDEVSYIVRYRPAEQLPEADWIMLPATTGNASTSIVTGLSPQVKYEFSVAARNTQGQGAWSSVRSFVTADVASAPETLTAEPGYRSDTELDVDWDAPDANGGSLVTAYEVRYRKANASSWSTKTTGMTTSTTLDRLTPGTAYVVEVRAINGVGAGPAAVTEAKTSGRAPLLTQPARWVKSFGKLTGQPKVGATYRVSRPAYSPEGATKRLVARYQWYFAAKPVRGATKTFYKVPKAARGKIVSVRVTISKPGYKARAVTFKSPKIR